MTGTYGYGQAINESGVIAGWYGTPYGGSYACYWDSAGVHTIGAVGTAAYGINNKNQISLDNGEIWDPILGLRSIGSLGGGYCEPFDINDNGQVVGYSHTLSSDSHAFIWNDDHWNT